MEGQPRLYTLEAEKNPNTGKLDHKERPLEPVSTGTEEISSNDKLKHAQETLLTPKQWEKFLRANIAVDQKTDFKQRANFENIFVSELQDLPDREIEALIEQFNRGFKNFILNYKGNTQITPEQKRKIFEDDQKVTKTMRGNIHSNSILNVIHFIRARKQIHKATPKEEFALYTNPELDAHYKIDMVECTFKDVPEEEHLLVAERQIQEMNLIQIKSSEPSKEDMEKIYQAHKDWAQESLMNLKDVIAEYREDIPANLTLPELVRNSEEIQLFLLDIITNPDPKYVSKPAVVLEKLGITNAMTDKNKAWLLFVYGKRIRDQIEESILSGDVPEEEGNNIIHIIETLEEETARKAKLPRKVGLVQTINSIITVGPKIVFQRNITDRNEYSGSHYDKVVKYN